MSAEQTGREKVLPKDQVPKTEVQQARGPRGVQSEPSRWELSRVHQQMLCGWPLTCPLLHRQEKLTLIGSLR